MTTRLLFSAVLIGMAHIPIHAATVTLDAEVLKDSLGAPMPISGLVVLTAGTTGSFFGPTATGFVGGSEVILKTWDLSSFATPGLLSVTTGDIPFGGGWDTGDPLRIYWYPTLSLASLAPGAGTPYGTYRDATGVDGSAAWTTAGLGDTIALKFYTSDATFLNSGGSNTANAGRASSTVVPEPGTTALSLMALFAVLGISRSRHAK